MSTVLALHNSHNASICEIKNKEIVYFQEAERLDVLKHSKNWKILLNKYINTKFDKIIFINSAVDMDERVETKEVKLILEQYNIEYKELENDINHHFYHACCAFFNSNLEQSYVFVLDRNGTYIDPERVEAASLYLFKKNKFKKIFKVYGTNSEKEYVENNNFYINTLSLGGMYTLVQQALKLKEEGAVMALSGYSNHDEAGFKFFTQKFGHFKSIWKIIRTLVTRADRVYMAKSVQLELEKIVLKYVKNIIKTKNRNLCVSGGVFQNTVLNSKILDICPNLYVDPCADDSGIAMGAALWDLNKNKFVKKRIKTLFLGDIPNYQYLNLKEGHNTTPKEVAKIIAEKNIVAIYQGRNELGKRALGNRSFLYDPRDIYAKEKINLLKDREWCRPTAGTILYEKRNEWFDLKSKDENEFMSYVFQVKKKDIPGITHVDNSCRIQTLKKEQNYHYYNLINEFYQLTGVPILLNTSFNLGGKPLVNSVKDAMDTLSIPHNYKFNYLYFPEIGKIYNKNRRKL